MNNKKGYTLIELIMVIVILGIFFSLSAGSLIPIFTKGFTTSGDREELRNQARLVTTLLSRDVRNMQDANSLLTAGSSNIVFTNVDGQQIGYSLSGATLNKTINGTSYELASNVKTLQFLYLDNNLATIAGPILGPTLTTNVRIIDTTLVLSNNGQQISVDFQVRPRNVY